MKLKFAIPFILIAIIFFNSCKKYEEGPFISFRSTKNRLSGSWKIESFTANGADSMSYIYRYHLEGQWIIGKDNGPDYPPLSVTTGTYTYIGEYSSGFPRTNISTSFTNFENNNINVFGRPFPAYWVLDNNWQIIKLKTGDMKWRVDRSGIVYEIAFKPY